MTDKVQKIREEVERLQYELVREKEKGFGSDADDTCILELQNVLTYIDSLQEEPVREDLMSKIKKFTDNYFPIIDNGINIPARNELRDIFSEAARMGAQWQREKHLSNIDIDAIWGELVCRGVERLSRADVEEFVERLKEGKYDKRTD